MWAHISLEVLDEKSDGDGIIAMNVQLKNECAVGNDRSLLESPAREEFSSGVYEVVAIPISKSCTKSHTALKSLEPRSESCAMFFHPVLAFDRFLGERTLFTCLFYANTIFFIP